MIAKSRVRLAFFLVIAVLSAARASDGSELNDGMQLYFDGNFKAAQQHLTALIQQGQADARMHYFRGLASARLGDAAAADLDFQKGAELEVTGTGTEIGRALQRVQGLDRLRLEKFRRMARLNARQRVQPVAPKPISRDDQVPRIIAVSPEPSPTFRLASEVPLRRTSRPTNPFADDTAALAAQDQLPGGPQASSTGITAADDAPVGTGVAGVGSAATKGAGAEADPFGDVAADTIPADPFAADPFAADPFAASASPPVAAPAAPSRKSTGIFGAVFRAIRKATIPQLDPAAMLPPGMGPPAGGPRQPAINQFPEDSFPKDDPFGDPAEGSDEIPGGDDADPFGL